MPRKADPLRHPTAIDILEYVRVHPHSTLAEIAEGVQLAHASTAKIHVDRLVAAGKLIDRRLRSGERMPRSLEVAPQQDEDPK